MLRVWILTTNPRKFRANLESLGLILISMSPQYLQQSLYRRKPNFSLKLSKYGRACAKYYHI